MPRNKLSKWSKEQLLYGFEMTHVWITLQLKQESLFLI